MEPFFAQHPTFLTAAWVAVLLIGGFAIVDGIVGSIAVTKRGRNVTLFYGS